MIHLWIAWKYVEEFSTIENHQDGCNFYSPVRQPAGSGYKNIRISTLSYQNKRLIIYTNYKYEGII